MQNSSKLSVANLLRHEGHWTVEENRKIASTRFAIVESEKLFGLIGQDLTLVIQINHLEDLNFIPHLLALKVNLQQ